MYARIMILAIGSALLLGSASAGADSKTEAKKHFNAGLALHQAEDFKAAAAEFEASVKLFPTKGGLYNLANCYRALHRYADAIAVFRRLQSDFKNKLDAEMRQDVEFQIQEIEGLVARLTIEASPAGASVTVDESEIGKSPIAEPLLLGPGGHAIRVALEGYETLESQVNLVSGEKKVASFVLKPIPARLRVHANVDGASVILDGTLLGTTPLPKEMTLSVGRHTIRVVREGYEPSEQSLEAKSGESLSLSFALLEKKPPPAPVAPPPTPAPAPSKEEDSGLSALFWVGFSGTIICGAGAGVFYGLSYYRANDFNTNKQDYEDNLTDLRDDPTDQALLEYSDKKYNSMTKARDDAVLMNNIGMGLAIAGGALALGTIIVLIVDLTDTESDGTEGTGGVQAAVTPDGFRVVF